MVDIIDTVDTDVVGTSISTAMEVTAIDPTVKGTGISRTIQVSAYNDASSAYEKKLKGKGAVKFYHLPTGRVIGFKAFITKFSDNFTSKWNEESVYGRMDPIPVFENTVRRIELGFDVIAGSLAEAKLNLANIDKFVQCLYPTYEKVNGFNVLSTAPVWRVKFANLISRTNSGISSVKRSGLMSYISGFNFEPDLEPGVIMDDDKIYPKLIRMNLSLGILHEHTPGFVAAGKKAKFASGKHVFPYGAGSRSLVTKDKTGIASSPSKPGATPTKPAPKPKPVAKPKPTPSRKPKKKPPTSITSPTKKTPPHTGGTGGGGGASKY